MNEPWRAPEVCRLAVAIVTTFRHHTGRDLVAPGLVGHALADALYTRPGPVVAHDGTADPCYVYANRAAQELWGYAWADFVVMPSRLTAPAEERVQREGLLATARAAGVITVPGLVRITRDGRRFRIAEIAVWNLDHGGMPGQAAAFDRWDFI